MIGVWGWGIGVWGLGIGPNPQSPIPNPQSPIPIFKNKNLKFILLKKILIYIKLILFLSNFNKKLKLIFFIIWKMIIIIIIILHESIFIIYLN